VSNICNCRNRSIITSSRMLYSVLSIVWLAWLLMWRASLFISYVTSLFSPTIPYTYLLVLVDVGRRVHYELLLPHSWSRRFLKVFTVLALTALSGSSFQWRMTLWLKKFFLRSKRHLVVRTLVLIQSGRSLTKSRKRSGPSTDPWGTPLSTFQASSLSG